MSEETKQWQVKVSDALLAGTYANFLQAAHTPEEFVLDFINLFPPDGVVTARIILSPAHAKRIAQALISNVQTYEQRFGEIKDLAKRDGEITNLLYKGEGE